MRVPNWLGDAVLSTPALEVLKNNYAHAHLTVLARETVKEVFQANPAVGEIITIPVGRGYRQAGKRLRGKEFDSGILFTNSFSSALIFYLAGIPRRIGYATDGRSLLLTGRMRRRPDFRKEHQVNYYLHLAEEASDGSGPRQIASAGQKPLIWNVTGVEDERAEGLLRNAGVSVRHGLIGINPGATYGRAKRWFPDRFADLGDRISERYGVRIIIFGSSEDRAVADSVVSLMRTKPVNLAGQTNLRELAALLRRCALFITNDTGTMHVAAAVRIPTVAIFGSTEPVRTGPWGEGHIIVREGVPCSPCLQKECPRGDYLCFTKITVEDVLKAAEKQLARG